MFIQNVHFALATILLYFNTVDKFENKITLKFLIVWDCGYTTV